MARKKPEVKVICEGKFPEYAHATDSGCDLSYCGDRMVTLQPGERAVLPTGLKIELPSGYEAQIRPRSGLAAKYGITVVNTPGTVDTSYQGEIKIILINHGKEKFSIKNGDRIAQMVVSPVVQAKFQVVDTFEEETERGENGFGSTGV